MPLMSETCGIALVEVFQHSRRKPGAYNLLASHNIILEGYSKYFHHFPSDIQARLLYFSSSDFSSKEQSLLLK